MMRFLACEPRRGARAPGSRPWRDGCWVPALEHPAFGLRLADVAWVGGQTRRRGCIRRPPISSTAVRRAHGSVSSSAGRSCVGDRGGESYISPEVQREASKGWACERDVELVLHEPEENVSGASMDGPVFNRLMGAYGAAGVAGTEGVRDRDGVQARRLATVRERGPAKERSRSVVVTNSTATGSPAATSPWVTCYLLRRRRRIGFARRPRCSCACERGSEG